MEAVAEEMAAALVALVEALRVDAVEAVEAGRQVRAMSIRPALYSWVSATTSVIGGPCGGYYLKAAGDLTHLVVSTNWLPSFIAGTRIGKMLEIASGWSLVNSRVCV